MKNYIFIALLLFSINSAKSQTYNLDSIKNITRNDTITFIYMTALWCSPCLKKMPYLDAYFSTTKKPYKLMYLIDRQGFSGEKLGKFFPFIDFRNKVVFFPLSYYSNRLIQINYHHKLFKKFINDNKLASPPIKNIEKFNLSSLLAIDSKGNGLVFDAPDLQNLDLKAIDDLFSSLIKSL